MLSFPASEACLRISLLLSRSFAVLRTWVFIAKSIRSSDPCCSFAILHDSMIGWIRVSRFEDGIFSPEQAAVTPPQRWCPSTTITWAPRILTANSRLPMAMGSALLPATRTTNISPRPWSKIASDGSRLSEQLSTETGGCWIFSRRRRWETISRESGVPATNRLLPSINEFQISSAEVVSISLDADCIFSEITMSGMINDFSRERPHAQASRFHGNDYSPVARQRRPALVRNSKDDVNGFRFGNFWSNKYRVIHIFGDIHLNGLFVGSGLGVLQPKKAQAVAIRVCAPVRDEFKFFSRSHGYGVWTTQDGNRWMVRFRVGL